MIRRSLAVTLDFGARLTASVVLAFPFASAVAATNIGHFPEGDRLLFADGGLVLSEVVRLLEPAASPFVRASAMTGLLLAVALLLPHAALLVVLSEERAEPVPRICARACASFPALCALSGAAFLLQVLLWIGAGGVAGAARGALAGRSAFVQDAAWLLAIGLGGLVVLGVGAARDVCRSAAVVQALDSRSAAREGLRRLGERPWRAAAAYAVPAAAGVALVVLAAVLTDWLDVSRAGTTRFALVLLLHQATALGLAFCRAAWLAKAVALVRPQPEPSSSARR